MKLTVLDMTQSILSSLSSDEVNSIGDTVESLQVVEILKTTFFNMINRLNLPEQTEMFQLTSSTDITLPILMYRPDNVARIEWIKYYDSTKVQPEWKYVTILPNRQFVDYINSFNPTETNVDPYTFNDGTNTFNLLFKDDTQPLYCTSIKNYYILFDAYDSTLDSTLQSSKTMCYGATTPIWRSEDNFIPALDDQQFPLLLNEAKALAFFELKQTPHVKAEQESKRQWSSVQKHKALTDSPTSFEKLPDFGRKHGGLRGRWKR